MIEMRPSSIKNEKMNRILEKTSKVDKNSLYLCKYCFLGRVL